MTRKHLKYLEEESIEIIRNTFSNSSNPLILYSIGKDSSVLLHLFQKAFFPLKMPVQLLHIDTGWKFQSMIKFRDKIVEKHNLNLIVYKNKKGIKDGVNPFDHDNYTTIMKTDALKEALSQNKYDFIYGGARRDEEKSRSKEKVLSHRNKFHVWDPKDQRIEPWHIFNTYKQNDESFRIFPLSNWTELNVWEYINYQSIEIVPLYFSELRTVVKRENNYFLVDDNRFKFKKDELAIKKNVRFRTLGCYPLTAGIESSAKTINQIINELKKTNFTERSGRLIDLDKEGSMELKKREGYF
jgi:sulfate adenylyltransferase subunit 2